MNFLPVCMPLGPDPDPEAKKTGAFLRRTARGGGCPCCSEGKLDYNGLLELECPVCGFVIGGVASCT